MGTKYFNIDEFVAQLTSKLEMKPPEHKKRGKK
jgi:hypothetical protein